MQAPEITFFLLKPVAILEIIASIKRLDRVRDIR